MRPAIALAWFCGVLLAGIYLAWSAADAYGQSSRRRVVVVDRATGATPLSTIIQSQADYVEAYGEFLESVATARKIHAEAFALEIENSVKYTEAYFKRREINRLNNPPVVYMETVKRQEALRENKMKKYFAEVLKDDPARQLNWLLTQLSGPTMAIQYLAGSHSLSEFDQKLSKDDQRQIWLSDGGLSGHLEFSLGEGQALKTPWPFALRATEFDAARNEFETARNNAIKEVQASGQVSHAAGEQLIKSVSRLLVLLEEVYPDDVRHQDSRAFLTYNSAKHYLKSLVGQVSRVCATNDSAFLRGASRFEGQTVLELVQYLYQNGLVFAKPQPGGERVYRNLLTNLRNMYIKLGTDNAQEANRQPAPAQAASGQTAPKQ